MTQCFADLRAVHDMNALPETVLDLDRGLKRTLDSQNLEQVGATEWHVVRLSPEEEEVKVWFVGYKIKATKKVPA